MLPVATVAIMIVESSMLTKDDLFRLRTSRARLPDSGSRGLGDTIAKGIELLSGGRVKQCGGCKKRQAALNRLVPYKKQGGVS